MLECFSKPRFSFTREARKFGDEFSDCRIKVAGGRTAMNVASRQREARTGGKALSCAAMATQHHIGRECIVREATHRADLFSRKSVQ
jgi:hypothetical protein